MPSAVGRSLAKSSLWNLAGFGLPLLAALVAVPVIINRLGAERFGILAIAWAIIGTASLLDLGIGRSLTRLVAKHRSTLHATELPSMVFTSVALLAALAIVAAVALLALAPWLVLQVFRIDANHAGEAERAITLLAVSLPFVLSSGALQGVLDGYLRFDLSNLVRIPVSALNYLAPLCVLPFTDDLGWLVGATVLVRICACAVHALLVGRLLRQAGAAAHLRLALLGPVLTVGGWMTVSTIIATLIVYLDRFVIGAFSSMQEVAFYATPFEVVTRLSMLPGAVSVALLPMFSAIAAESRDELERFFGSGLRYVVLLLFPAALLIALFAREGLALWVGEEFASSSAGVARMLAAGVFVNGLAFIPFTLLYAVGRADVVAKLHLAELPVYALLLWQLVVRFGAEGAAAAWTLRVIVDAALLFLLARRLYPALDLRLFRVTVAAFGGLGALAIAAALPTTSVRVAYAVAMLAAFTALAWWRLLAPAERLALGRIMGRGQDRR
jgi:O-antigen/teichoic acid export membrane protein